MTKFLIHLIAYTVGLTVTLATDSTIIMIGLNQFGYPIGFWPSVGLGVVIMGAAGIFKFAFSGMEKITNATK